jgi:AcrR family transcriptional regulator
MSIEQQILDSAREEFLLYGYHGATLFRISERAKANKAAIHYYFRSKENLYQHVVKEIFSEMINLFHIDYNILWFIMTEYRNNRVMLLKELNNTEERNVQEVFSFLEYAFKNKSFFEVQQWLKQKQE